MAYQWFIGIDISKQALDITVLSNGEKKMYGQIQNSNSAIKVFLKKLSAEQKVSPVDCVFCLKHTGIYNAHFLRVMEEKKLRVCLESSVQIKQSGGLQRGKKDKIGSYRIASVRGKTRTSKKANLKAKSLLHMAALVAARFSEEIRAYYERK